jgi:hypothetical protein
MTFKGVIMPAPLISPPSKEELTKLYIEDSLSQRDIGKLYTLGQSTIGRLLRKYKITQRSKSEANVVMYNKKPEIRFKVGGAKHSLGDKYKKAYQEVRLAIRPYIQQYKLDKICSICNSENDLKVHHVDEFSKTFTELIKASNSILEAQVTYIQNHYSNEVKLEVLCEECHKIKHHKLT